MTILAQLSLLQQNIFYATERTAWLRSACAAWWAIADQMRKPMCLLLKEFNTIEASFNVYTYVQMLRYVMLWDQLQVRAVCYSPVGLTTTVSYTVDSICICFIAIGCFWVIIFVCVMVGSQLICKSTWHVCNMLCCPPVSRLYFFVIFFSKPSCFLYFFQRSQSWEQTQWNKTFWF